jgi:hypothetical protein
MVTIVGAAAIIAPTSLHAQQAGTVTFSKDVAPIFQQKCQSCHQPGSIAPMPLLTFEQARPWVRSIRERVASRQMPPWHIDRAVGVRKFKNDMSLTDEQVDTIVKWVDQGALQGDPKDLPAPKTLDASNEWRAVKDGYGPPDLVVKSGDMTMAAVSQDEWWRSISDVPLTEPRWIRMVEIRSSNIKARQILHHSVAYQVINPDNTDSLRSGFASPGGGAPDPDDLANRRPFLMEWAIGKSYDRYPDGTGKLFQPGEKIAFDQHIHAVGEEVTGGSELGIWFYPKGQEPKKRIYLASFSSLRRQQPGASPLDIPPNSVTESEGFTVLKENTVLTNFQPHFHLRGKTMEVEAILPDGTTQVVSYVDRFNFNWMTNYIYADDAAPAFPKGTVIHVTSLYDNTKANRNNPDPDQWVGFGDRTVDEMGHAWVNVYYLSDDEYAAYQAAHKAKMGTTQNQ